MGVGKEIVEGHFGGRRRRQLVLLFIDMTEIEEDKSKGQLESN
jgi:hypothetical protein